MREEHSLSFLTLEREELTKDLEAFKQANTILCRRLVESNDIPRPRRPLLHEWSGSRAVIGSLDMAIHAIERTLGQTYFLIAEIEAGRIDNSDKPDHPGLGVVDGGKK